MKTNMGGNDRVGRTVFAVLVLLLYMMDIITGNVATVLLVLSIVFVLTSVVGFCPLYRLLGVSTSKK
jgi:hypothetical protein